MTLKELLEWAEKNDCLDCDVCVQYRDDGACIMEGTMIFIRHWNGLTLKRLLYCKKGEHNETYRFLKIRSRGL